MWRPRLNFVTLHYAYIIFMGLLALPILYPAGNLRAVDAYFFGASGSTESGLNTVDVKALYTYQQLYIYFIPILTNLGFINIIVVVVRLYWFRKHIKQVAPRLLHARRRNREEDDDIGDVEGHSKGYTIFNSEDASTDPTVTDERNTVARNETAAPSERSEATDCHEGDCDANAATDGELRQHIAFDVSAEKHAHPKNDCALYIPGPREREHGEPLVEVDKESLGFQDDRIEPIPGPSSSDKGGLRHRFEGPSLSQTKSLDRAASIATSMFVIGSKVQRRSSTVVRQQPALNDMPYLSREATVGRNSQFHNLSSRDRMELGGIEYRSLKLLLKIVLAYFFGLHLFGVICLIGWIHYSNPKYRAYLDECGQDKNWWAFYSAQTMVDNLGFTLTPDSMVSFSDAQWPMFIMSFLAFAGNTLYPVFLRLVIWIMSKFIPHDASIQEPLAFLLKHPRRCYTLLFPRGTTWALFGIIFALNFVDTLLIIVLDLDNEAVASLPVGSRILAAIFQAASSRHTGTSSFNLADVNPAVQFSLVVMMYIAIFPIALSIRSSNTYEEKSLGVYDRAGSLNEEKGGTYLLTHLQNQLTFDLWYIFLGIFCICIAESQRIMDQNDPAFSVFAIFFEVTSAYGNVGLSLGHPSANTSLTGQFGVFGKLVICAMMIRGRHRGLPYELDRSIMLPDEHHLLDSSGTSDEWHDTA